jgi:methionyl aminopeptidase
MEVTIKTTEEIEKLKQGGHLLSEVLNVVAKAVKPGVTPEELDLLARKLIKEGGATPSFLHYGNPPYPAALCVSPNEVIVHGIPHNRPLKNGDIVGLDCGLWYQDLCTDMALTVPVGNISVELKKLLKVTKQSLMEGLKQVKAGNTTGDIGYAVQSYVEKHGFSVIRELTGHGVGYEVHEAPAIPNFGKPKSGTVLKTGMVIAIEPMVAVGAWPIKILANDWDVAMKDNSFSAHFEHTVVVTDKGFELITA